MKRLLRVMMARLAFSGMAIVCSPVVFADTVPVPAIGGSSPVVTTQNMVPVVSIVAPDGNGLSHNRYLSFDVPTQGLVLNNSLSAGTSALAGALSANANLGQRSATLILNEVTGLSPSRLQGRTEIFGDPASLVIANPNGIYSSGAGFINTPRVTLAAGVPQFASGALSGFDINAGSGSAGWIRLEGEALDARTVSTLDLVARSLSLTAPLVTEGEARLYAGAGIWRYNLAGFASGVVAADSSTPALAIDASALGTVSAGRIFIVANENGAGVRLDNRMSATADDIVISAQGGIQLNRELHAVHNVDVRSASVVDVQGKAMAGSDTLMTAQSLSIGNTGAVAAGGRLHLNAATDFANAGELAAGEEANIDAGTAWKNEGLIYSAGRFNAQANDWWNTGTLYAEQDMALSSLEGDITNDAQAQLYAGGRLSISSVGNLYSGEDSLLAAAGAMTVMAMNDIRIEGADVAAGGALRWRAGNAIAQNGFIHNASGADLNAWRYTQAGTIEGSGLLSIYSADNLSLADTSLIRQRGNTTLETTNALDNSGRIRISGDLRLQAMQISNAAGALVQVSQQADVQADAAINNSGFVSADTLQLSSAIITNATDATMAADTLLRAVAWSNSDYLDNAGTLFSNGEMQLTAMSRLYNRGRVQALGDLSLTVEGLLSHTGTDLASGGNFSLLAGSLSMDTGTDTRLIAGGNAQFQLQSELQWNAGTQYIFGADLLAEATAMSFRHDAPLQVSGNATLRATSSNGDITGARVQAGGDIHLQARRISSNEAVDLGAWLWSGGNMQLDALGYLMVRNRDDSGTQADSGLYAGGNLTLSGTSMDLMETDAVADGNIVFMSTVGIGGYDGSCRRRCRIMAGGRIEAREDLYSYGAQIEAGEDVAIQGLYQAGWDYSSPGVHLRPLLAAGHDVVIESAAGSKEFRQERADLLSGNNISIHADSTWSLGSDANIIAVGDVQIDTRELHNDGTISGGQPYISPLGVSTTMVAVPVAPAVPVMSAMDLAFVPVSGTAPQPPVIDDALLQSAGNAPAGTTLPDFLPPYTDNGSTHTGNSNNSGIASAGQSWLAAQTPLTLSRFSRTEQQFTGLQPISAPAVSVSGSVRIYADKLLNDGNIVTSGDMALVSQRFLNRGTVSAQAGDMLLSSDTLDNSGTISAGSAMDVQARRFNNQGDLQAHSLSLTATEGLGRNYGGQLQAYDLAIDLGASALDGINANWDAHNLSLTTTGNIAFRDTTYRQAGDLRLQAGDLSLYNSTLDTGCDLSLSASNDLSLQGSGTSSGCDTTLVAGGDLAIGTIEHKTTTQTKDYSGKTRYEYNTTIVTQQASSVVSGGQLGVQAGHDLSITGSSLSSTGDMQLLVEGDTTIGSALTSRQDSGWWRKKHTTKTDYKTWDILDVSHQLSTLQAGGNLFVNAGKNASGQGDGSLLRLSSAGNVTVAGAQISTAGQSYLSGEQVDMLAVKDYHGETRKKKSDGWFRDSKSTASQSAESLKRSELVAGTDAALLARRDISIVGSHVQAANDLNVAAGLSGKGSLTIAGATTSTSSSRSKQSSSLNVAGPLVGVGWSGHNEKSTAAESSSTLHGSVLSADRVSLQAPDDIVVTASQVVATDRVQLQAGGNVQVSTQQALGSSRAQYSEHDAGFFFDNHGLSTTEGERRRNEGRDSQGSSDVGSLIGASSGDVRIVAGGNYVQRGSELFAGRDIAIAANDIRFDAAEQRTQNEQYSRQSKGGVSGGISSPILSQLYNAYKSVERADEVKDSRLQDVLRAKASVDAAQAGMALSQLASNAGQGLQDRNVLKLSVSIGGSSARSDSDSESSTALPGSATAAGDISLQAKQDIRLEGTQLSAENIRLDAGRDIALHSAANRSSQEGDNKSSSGSIGIGFGLGGASAGFTIDIAAATARGNSDGDSLTHTEAKLNAGNTLSINSGNDTVLQGAIARADRINAVIGGDLTLQSEQDVESFESVQKSAGLNLSLCIPPFCVGASTVSGSYNQSDIGANYQSVKEQTGFYAGKGGFDIAVGQHTGLDGAVIASDADPIKNRLATNTLSHSTIENTLEWDASSLGMSFSGATDQHDKAGNTTGDDGKINPGMPGAYQDSDSQSGITQSAVAAGEIVVHNDEETGDDSTDDLSRDTAHANDGSLINSFDREEQETNMEVAQVQAELASTLAPVVFRKVGDIAQEHKWEDGSPEKIALHTLAAAGLAAIGGVDPLDAGLTGGLNEWLIGELKQELATQNLSADQEAEVMQAASALLGAVLDGDVGMALSLSAVQNNYLDHEQADKLRGRLEACQKHDQSCRDSVLREAEKVSKINNAALAAACVYPESAGCIRHLQSLLQGQQVLQGADSLLAIKNNTTGLSAETQTTLNNLKVVMDPDAAYVQYSREHCGGNNSLACADAFHDYMVKGPISRILGDSKDGIRHYLEGVPAGEQLSSGEIRMLGVLYAANEVLFPEDTLALISSLAGGVQLAQAGKALLGKVAKLESTGAGKVANSGKTAEQLLKADRIGSGLKDDAAHRAASFLSKEQLQAGKTFPLRGGDGVERTLLQTPGGLNGKNGIYEYILDPSGAVSHQRFIRGGVINGIPNQIVPKVP